MLTHERSLELWLVLIAVALDSKVHLVCQTSSHTCCLYCIVAMQSNSTLNSSGWKLYAHAAAALYVPEVDAINPSRYAMGAA